MEQQTDPKTTLDIAVGTDPAFVPVLTGPAPAVKEKEEESTATGPDAGAGPDDGSDDAGTDTTAGATGGDDVSTDRAGDDSDAPSADGPVFEVRDRRGSITADRSGIRFTLDDQEADFRWDEIGAVEVRPARFGRRFTVTVHVAVNRWFNAEVEAPVRGRLKEWTEEFDAVLDAYFEEA